MLLEFCGVCVLEAKYRVHLYLVCLIYQRIYTSEKSPIVLGSCIALPCDIPVIFQWIVIEAAMDSYPTTGEGSSLDLMSPTSDINSNQSTPVCARCRCVSSSRSLVARKMTFDHIDVVGDQSPVPKRARHHQAVDCSVTTSLEPASRSRGDIKIILPDSDSGSNSTSSVPHPHSNSGSNSTSSVPHPHRPWVRVSPFRTSTNPTRAVDDSAVRIATPVLDTQYYRGMLYVLPVRPAPGSYLPPLTFGYPGFSHILQPGPIYGSEESNHGGAHSITAGDVVQ